MGFSRQRQRSGFPFPISWDLPNPGIKPRSSALQKDSLPFKSPRKPIFLKLASKEEEKSIVQNTAWGVRHLVWVRHTNTGGVHICTSDAQPSCLSPEAPGEGNWVNCHLRSWDGSSMPPRSLTAFSSSKQGCHSSHLWPWHCMCSKQQDSWYSGRMEMPPDTVCSAEWTMYTPAVPHNSTCRAKCMILVGTEIWISEPRTYLSNEQITESTWASLSREGWSLRLADANYFIQNG